jgi:hypothetical protein
MALIAQQVQKTSPLIAPARSADLRQTTLARRLPQQGGTASPMPNPPITDPNALSSSITPENTLRGQRLGFGPEAQQVTMQPIQAERTQQSIAATFASQLPQLQQQFADEAEMLAQRTSALGRTGSGMFNKETGFIGDRAVQAREALLGNLAFQAIQSDAQRALAAQQANQSYGLQQQNLAAQIAEANASRRGEVDFARQAFLERLQAREDALAQQALNARAQQLQFLQQGFSGDPTGAIGIAAQTGLQGAGSFGEQAGIAGQQAGALSAEAIQAIMNQFPQLLPQQQPQVPQGQMVLNDIGVTA